MQTTCADGTRYFHALPSQGGGDQTAVLIHGLGTSLDFWHLVAQPLSETSTTVALDLAGSGDSARPEGPYTLQTVAHEANEFLDRLELKNVTLVGHSLGALVALQMADLRPDIPTRLILVDPTLFEVEAVLTSPVAALRNPKMLGINVLNFLSVAFPPFMTQRLVKYKLFRRLALSTYFYDPINIDPVDLQKALRKTGGWRRVWRLLRVVPAARQVKLAQLMSRISTPTAILYGDVDPLLTAADLMRTRKILCVTDEVVFQNCGHMPMLEVPELLLKALKRLICGDRRK